jgi:hypothetical protein
MDIGAYRKYLQQYVQEAYQNSDGSPGGVIDQLRSIKPPGRFTASRHEKQVALSEALKAFEEHRHWPLEIILSHLGVEIEK